MNERTYITNPIQIKDNSKERVAFDLMEKIANYERGSTANAIKEVVEAQQSREYWLKLYNQSSKVVDYIDIDIDELLKD